MDIHEKLKEFDLFSNLDERALKELAKKAFLKILEPRETIFNEGFEGEFFFLLLKGSVRLFKTSYDGKESTIKIIRPGEIFAEAILYLRTEYPVTAVTAVESEIIGIHRDSFRDMMRDPVSGGLFIGTVFEKLRFLTDQIHYFSTHDVEDRFFRFLIKTYGRKYRYDISIAKKDIASAIGTIPETFSRLLLRLTKRGAIAWKKNTLILKEGFWDNDYFDE